MVAEFGRLNDAEGQDLREQLRAAREEAHTAREELRIMRAHLTRLLYVLVRDVAPGGEVTLMVVRARQLLTMLPQPELEAFAKAHAALLLAHGDKTITGRLD
jgi:hypothetical protein